MSDIRSKVRAFLRAVNMPKTRFGRLAVNDPNFVDRLNHSEPRPKTVAKVRAFMENYKP